MMPRQRYLLWPGLDFYNRPNSPTFLIMAALINQTCYKLQAGKNYKDLP
jgi:hypothetical protein